MISQANDACARASKNGVLLVETSDVDEKFENWSQASSLGIFTPLLVVTCFFLKGAFIEIEEKKMKQPIVVWSANVSPPGRKKTPMHKLACDDVEILSKHCERNFVKCSINNVMWEGGTMEALKKSLNNAKTSDDCALIASNYLNSILDDADECSSTKEVTEFFYDLHDSIGLRRNKIVMEVFMWEK